jgi:tetratricopeptide (TPR) repeat protein
MEAWQMISKKNLLILLMIGFSAFDFSVSRAEKAIMGLNPGDQAPDFQIRTIDGRKTTMAMLKGKIVILAFWKRDKGSSRKALVDLERIYQEYRDRGVIALAVNADKAPEPEIRGIRASQNLSYLMAGDPELKIYSRFGAMVLPTTLIVGPDGKLAFYRSMYPRNFYGQIRGHVRLLLGEITQAQLEAELHPEKMLKDLEARKKAKRYLHLGQSMMKINLREKARMQLENAVRADPSFPEPRILLARIYLQDKEVSKGVAELEQALELDPDSKEARLLQGMAYAIQGQDSLAMSVLEELVKNNPKPPPEAYYHIGKIHERQDRTSQALEAYRMALELILGK